jgi:nicotinic acid mononucleotide adenylyltransferase
MVKFLQLSALALAIATTNVSAHHPAADNIADEDVYEMIDSMVADTPHASMTFDEMGGGMTETSITTDSLEEFEVLIEEQDLLGYVEQLDGVVDVSIQFNIDSSVTMTVNQVR